MHNAHVQYVWYVQKVIKYTIRVMLLTDIRRYAYVHEFYSKALWVWVVALFLLGVYYI